MKTEPDDDGQVMILFAVVVTVLISMAAFILDGGFGLVQMRRAQNAADFASLAASKLMPCAVGANSAVTGDQIRQTIQNMVDDNMSGSTTSWTAKYLDTSGNPIAGGTFSSSSSLAPPSNACGVSVNVTGTWNTYLAKLAGFSSISAQQGAGSMGSGSSGYNLAIASLLPYARHTIYAGAVGQFTVNGSMYDNSVAQCNDRKDSCLNYSSCLSGTPVSNITCYGDSADVFQESSETITGTLYSVAPVAIDSCFYKAPTSGAAKAMTFASYPLYYLTYGCSGEFSSATSPLSYGGLQGNASLTSDPLANLPDPTSASNAATICPGQTSASTHNTNVISSGSLQPGVYTNTVVITGSVSLLPCQSSGITTSPGIYVFQKGLEICPASGKTVTGTDVMLYNSAAPASTYSNTNSNASGYCVSAPGSNGTVTDGIDIGGANGSKVTLTAPDSGVYEGVSLYQSRTTNLNIGLDDGWTHSSSTTYSSDSATINITGVVYDNSYTNEPSSLVFSDISQSYGGPYGALCAGATSSSTSGDPQPCPGITGSPVTNGLTNTLGKITIDGAVIVGAFGTTGGTASSPLTLTITFDSSNVPPSVSGVHLAF